MFGKEIDDGSRIHPPTTSYHDHSLGAGTQSPSSQQHYEMAGNKMTGSLQHRVTSPTHPATTVEPARLSSDIAQPTAEYTERVQALHACKYIFIYTLLFLF